MKKTDIAMIVLIAAGCIMVAFFITNSIIGSPEEELVTVPTIEAIEGTLTEPDPSIFNSNAINPTIEVQIDTENTTDVQPTSTDESQSVDGAESAQ